MSSGPDRIEGAAAAFCEVACRLGYLSEQDAERLQSESDRSEQHPGPTALALGLMDAVQVDAAETLVRPTDAVPGYEVLDVLGRGGMGMVYLSRQTSLGRVVALKTVLISRMNDIAVARRFEQEARTLAQLRHPNIVAIHDFGSASGRLYFAMERVEGIDVHSLLEQEGPLSEAKAWGIARQVAAGLSHADRLGIVHRDIKPANLLLVEPPDGFPLPPGMPMVKIADFGLALLTEQAEVSTRLTSDNATVGSPHYMAPEQFQGSRVDSRADIYSLGATVYHMLADTPPFNGLSLPQIIAQKLSTGPAELESLRPDLSPNTTALVRSMMSAESRSRPAGYAALLQQIDAIWPSVADQAPEFPVRFDDVDSTITADGAQVETREMPTAQSTPWFGRRTLTKWIVLVCVAAAAVAAGVWMLPGARTHILPQRTPMAETGPGRYLFNGTSILDWTNLSGQWSVPPGESVIAGTDGLLARTLFKNVDGRAVAPPYYRLILLVHRRDAQAAEVHFGLAAVAGRNGPRYVLSVTADGVALGERTNDTAPLTVLEAMPLELPGAAVVVIERQPEGWFAGVNDLKPAALPLRPEELPEFRIGVANGTAWFSDVEIVELEPAPEAGEPAAP